MQNIHSDLLLRFNSTINQWITTLEQYSLEQLSFKPAYGGWSMGQLYQHIKDDTNWYFKQLEIAILDKDYVNCEKSKEAQILFIKESFGTTRIQGDPSTAEKVQQPRDVFQLKKDYNNLKKHAEIIYSNILFHSSQGKSKHPGLGYFTCREWFQFAEIHMRHHLQQKNRLETCLKENR